MSVYILDGFQDEELKQAIHDDPAFPLIRELCFKFGLKVLNFTEMGINEGEKRKFQLCLPNGIAVCKAWAVAASGKCAFYYRSPYYKKERGRTLEDKETLHSTKVSSLMAVLKRVGAIPSIADMNEKKTKLIKDAVGLLIGAQGGTHKSAELSANEVHALLCAYLGETPNGNHLTIDTIKCQRVLDKYNEADKVAVKQMDEYKRFFHNPFYLVGADGHGHFLVSKVKIVGDTQYEIIEPFKRYKDITECEELIPEMTMTKLAYENKHVLQNGYLPVTDKYDENLDAAFFYKERATHYDYIWMATPC
jgi:D-alanine-D-alanine ligase-like ATP-grasp enzyme